MRNNDVPPCVQLEYLKRIDQKKKKSMCVCVFEKIIAEKIVYLSKNINFQVQR